MKIREVISEATAGKLKPRQQQPSRGIHKFTDAERWNSDYKQYRLGLALAETDGITPPGVDYESWYGRWKTAHPYTQQEADMLKLAYAATKVAYQDLNNGDLRSQELESTNKISPIAPQKKNRYGV